MHRLLARDLRRSHPHLWVLVGVWVLLALLAGASLGASLLGDDVVRPPLGSAQYVLQGLFPAWLGTALIIYWAPRLTLAAGALLGVAYEATAVGIDGVGWLAAGFAVVALAWVFWRDTRAVPRGPRVVSATEEEWSGSWAEGDAAFDRKVSLVVVAALLLLTAVGLAIHHFMAADVATFEARAQRAQASIVEVSEEPYEMVVEVEGRRFTFERFYVGEGEGPGVGDRIEVLVDGDRAAPVGQGQGNPGFILGIVACLPLLAVALGLRLGTRLTRRRRIALRGAPSTTVRLLWSDDFEALALPTDDSTPLLRLVNLTGIHDLEQDEDLPEFDPEPDELPTSDEEIAEFLRIQREGPELSADELAEQEAVFGPFIQDTEPFLLVGDSWAQGAPVALLRESGQAWFAEVSFGKPVWDRRAVVEAGAGGGRPVDRTLRAIPAWAVRNAGWLRWVIAALSGVASFGMLLLVFWGESLDLWAVPLLLVGAAGPPTATRWFNDGVSPARDGLRVHGMFLDQICARDRVSAVVPVADHVGIRLIEPDALVEVSADTVGLGAEGAADRLRRIVAEAPVGARSRRVPSPASFASLGVVVAAVLALVVW